MLLVFVILEQLKKRIGLCSYMGYSILALRSSLPPLRQQTSSSGSSGSGSSSTKPVAGLDGEYDEAATVRFTAWVAFNSTSNTTNWEVPSSCGASGFEISVRPRPG